MANTKSILDLRCPVCGKKLESHIYQYDMFATHGLPSFHGDLQGFTCYQDHDRPREFVVHPNGRWYKWTGGTGWQEMRPLHKIEQKPRKCGTLIGERLFQL